MQLAKVRGVEHREEDGKECIGQLVIRFDRKSP